MARREAKHLKALYFDLRVKDLKEYYSETNPNGAYGRIRDFLLKRNFSMSSIPDIIPNLRLQIWRFLT